MQRTCRMRWPRLLYGQHATEKPFLILPSLWQWQKENHGLGKKVGTCANENTHANVTYLLSAGLKMLCPCRNLSVSTFCPPPSLPRGDRLVRTIQVLPPLTHPHAPLVSTTQCSAFHYPHQKPLHMLELSYQSTIANLPKFLKTEFCNMFPESSRYKDASLTTTIESTTSCCLPSWLRTNWQNANFILVGKAFI